MSACGIWIPIFFGLLGLVTFAFILLFMDYNDLMNETDRLRSDLEDV